MAETSSSTPPRRSQRAEQKERTRAKLIDATLAVVADQGLSGTTMGKVAKKAGLSQGIVNFHFESKELLLCQTLDHLTAEYRRVWQEALDKAGDHPADQLEAVVRALLHPKIADTTHLACWFAYWGDAYARGIYRRIGSGVDARTAQAIEELCRELLELTGVERHDPQQVAENIVAMVTGHWLMTLLRPDEINLEQATASCLSYLADVFPGHFRATPEGA